MAIKVACVHKSYKNAGGILHVLKGIDIEFKDGEVVAIVGPSGAGKSTLLHVMGGLDEPDKGIIFLDKDNVYHLKDAARARLRNNRIGFVFQFYHLLQEFTALENVILPAMIQVDSDDVKKFTQRGMELLERVGLKDRAKHKPNQLSGGEQQRVAIARALINDPSIMLCDEPTGNLDSESGKEVIDILMRMNQNKGHTIVIATHDEKIAEKANRTIKISDGKIVN